MTNWMSSKHLFLGGVRTVQNVRIVNCGSEVPDVGYRSQGKYTDTVFWRLSYWYDQDVVLGHHHLRPPQILPLNMDINLYLSGSHRERYVFTPTVFSGNIGGQSFGRRQKRGHRHPSSASVWTVMEISGTRDEHLWRVQGLLVGNPSILLPLVPLHKSTGFEEV